MFRLFKQSTHLSEIKMSYFEHFKFSSFLGIEFARHSYFAFIHAMFPDIYTTSSSDGVCHIKKEMDQMKEQIEKRIIENKMKEIRKKFAQYK